MATFRQLKTGLRRRMGEPLQGTWGKYRYEDDDENQLTDEIGETINDAQILFARDLHARVGAESYPFIRYDSEIPIVSGQDIYTLPEDFVAVEELRYIRGSQNYPIHRKHIKHARYGFERTIAGGILQYYDYQGFTATYIAEGAADASFENTLQDSIGNFSSVRVGDVVYNLTDNSEAIVTSFQSGRVEVDGLQGGRANVFTTGDSYGIATQEENRWALQVYPRISSTDRLIYVGISDAFMPTASDVIPITGISARFTELPADYENDEVVLFSILEDGKLLENPYGPSELGRENLRVGFNPLQLNIGNVNVPYTFQIQFRADKTYTVQATRENGDLLAIADIRIATRGSDRMLMTYARSPRLMKVDNSTCEFPNEFNEPIYKRGKIILHEKLNNEGVAPQLYQEYDYELEMSEDSLLNRDESGPMQIDTGGDIVDYQRNANFTPYFR